MRISRKVLYLVAVVAAGCKTPATYGYHYEMAQQFGGAETPESANHEARALLASAKTVAFYPPDLCLNTDTARDGKHDKMVQANCGVLLSTLERAAERAGYEVLSWQNLRGQKRPIEYAREGNVDVLFEINELDLEAVADSQVQRSLTFYKVDDGGRSTLQVPQTVAQRCAAYSASLDPVQTAGLSGTIDIKTVSVSDGRDRWHYRKTLSQAIGRTYPDVGFKAQPKANRAASVIGGVGLGAAVLGLSLVLVSAATTNDPTTGEMKADFGSAPTLLIVGGAVLGAAGIAIALATQDSTGPEDVLCIQPGPEAATPSPPVVTGSDPMTSQVQLSETTGNDPLQRERQQLRDAMVVDFIGVLTEVHRSASAPSPTAPADPPK
ncbi:MAG: hypothetical protein ABI591_15290 [Kofleriaceae bacterium]